MEFLRKLRRLCVTMLALFVAQHLLVEINQQHVFHLCSSNSESNGECLDRHFNEKNFIIIYYRRLKDVRHPRSEPECKMVSGLSGKISHASQRQCRGRCSL